MTLPTSAVATAPRRWLAFAVLLAGAFLPRWISSSSMWPCRPFARLGATPAQIEWVISAYAATYAVFLISGGRLGDLFGRRRVFLAGMAGFGVASLIWGWRPRRRC